MSFIYPPKGWALCNGQLLQISGNQALFSLLSTTYGGDGRTNFGLPDLRGRVPLGLGRQWAQGESIGEEFHTLTTAEIPIHQHQLQAVSADANQPNPAGAMLAGANNAYTTFANATSLHPSSVSNTGGSQPHENRHPFTVLSWCIATTTGIYPSRN
jgi:microcystin-dependent protein